MAAEKLEERVRALEAEMEQLKARLEEEDKKKEPWWKAISGTFANDPIYEEAMRLGRKYRESTRPKPRKKSGKPRNGNS